MRSSLLFSTTFCFCMIRALVASLVDAQSDLSVNDRIAIDEKKIEGGALREKFTQSEYVRLTPRLAVVKCKMGHRPIA